MARGLHMLAITNPAARRGISPLIHRKVFSAFGRNASVQSLTLGEENLHRRRLRCIFSDSRKLPSCETIQSLPMWRHDCNKGTHRRGDDDGRLTTTAS